MPIADPALDLPLAGTPSSRFLTWTLAGLVGAAVLAFAVAAGADVALRRGAAARHRGAACGHGRGGRRGRDPPRAGPAADDAGRGLRDPGLARGAGQAGRALA